MRNLLLAAAAILTATSVSATGLTGFVGSVQSHSHSSIGSALSNNASSYQAFSGNVGQSTATFGRNSIGVNTMNESAFGETGWRNRRSGGAEAGGYSGGGVTFGGFRFR
jgi:hypothetical protein